MASLFSPWAGSEPLLSMMASGIFQVAAPLALTLVPGRLFALDHADGTLEQMLLSVVPTEGDRDR